jgi:hypothetical protein
MQGVGYTLHNIGHGKSVLAQGQFADNKRQKETKEKYKREVQVIST